MRIGIHSPDFMNQLRNKIGKCELEPADTVHVTYSGRFRKRENEERAGRRET